MQPRNSQVTLDSEKVKLLIMIRNRGDNIFSRLPKKIAQKIILPSNEALRVQSLAQQLIDACENYNNPSRFSWTKTIYRKIADECIELTNIIISDNIKFDSHNKKLFSLITLIQGLEFFLTYNESNRFNGLLMPIVQNNSIRGRYLKFDNFPINYDYYPEPNKHNLLTSKTLGNFIYLGFEKNIHQFYKYFDFCKTQAEPSFSYRMQCLALLVEVNDRLLKIKYLSDYYCYKVDPEGHYKQCTLEALIEKQYSDIQLLKPIENLLKPR